MFLAFQLVNKFYLMDDWHKSFFKSGVSSTHWCTSNCQNFDRHLVGATTVQKASKCSFSLCFRRLVFELIDAQFYASVEVLNELRIEQT